MPTVGTFEELATGTGTTRGFSRTLRGVIQRRPAHLLLSEVMGVAIGNLAKVIYLGVIPSPLDLFGLYVHNTLPVANGLYAYGSSHPWNVHSLLSRFTPSLSSGAIRVKPIVWWHRPKRLYQCQFHQKLPYCRTSSCYPARRAPYRSRCAGWDLGQVAASRDPALRACPG
jgi:hypothetical protein